MLKFSCHYRYAYKKFIFEFLFINLYFVKKYQKSHENFTQNFYILNTVETVMERADSV